MPYLSEYEYVSYYMASYMYVLICYNYNITVMYMLFVHDYIQGRLI